MSAPPNLTRSLRGGPRQGPTTRTPPRADRRETRKHAHIRTIVTNCSLLVAHCSFIKLGGPLLIVSSRLVSAPPATLPAMHVSSRLVWFRAACRVASLAFGTRIFNSCHPWDSKSATWHGQALPEGMSLADRTQLRDTSNNCMLARSSFRKNLPRLKTSILLIKILIFSSCHRRYNFAVVYC